MRNNIGFSKNDRYKDSNINILEIIGNADRGGMENYLKKFIRYLPDQFHLTYICPYESEFTSYLRGLNTGTVYIAAIDDDPFWNSIQMTTEVARLHQVDVIHAHMPKAHVLAGVVGALTDIPVVTTVHGMEITSHELGITKTVGSHLITNNQQAYLQALALGVPLAKVDLIRNGVDTSVFTPTQRLKSFRDDFSVPKEVPVIGFVGRLEYEKGPDLFLKAAEYIHQLMPQVHFLMVGDGSMKDQLKLSCTRMNLNEQMHFINWQNNNAYIFSEIDILAHTSRSDGTSLVLLEAMASECPTVAIGIGGVLEIVENRCSGLLAVDWEDVALKILDLLKHPAIIKEMGVAGRIRVERFFNVTTNTLRVAEILKDNLNRDSYDLKTVGKLRIVKKQRAKKTISKDSLETQL